MTIWIFVSTIILLDTKIDVANGIKYAFVTRAACESMLKDWGQDNPPETTMKCIPLELIR